MGACLSRKSHRRSVGESCNAANAATTAAAPPPRPVNMEHSSIPLGRRTNFGYARNFKRKYKIGKLLGHGQFGYTHVAIQIDTSDRMAVKKIEKKKMKTQIEVDDVKREVEILKALTGHENVVQFFAVFEDDEYVYIVMELCEGGELLDRIIAKKEGRYSEKDAAVLVRQILNVVARCHLHGVVHRDLKPENFLFKAPETSLLKAVDFGLSDFIKPGKNFNDIVGTLFFVAPEVLKKKSGPESDAWSIGVISYLLLCGRQPFHDNTRRGIINEVSFYEVMKKNPDYTEKPWPSISDSAKDFVQKLLVKDPSRRLTAAQALSHPWVREGGDALDIPLDISVLSNMREFVKYSRLKKVFLRALANTLDDDEMTHLRDQFNAIDVDGSGAITLDEIKQALEKNRPWDVKDSIVVQIVEAMDLNEDGLIDFDEFVVATIHVKQLEGNAEKWEKLSKAAFEQFDTDGDGFITSEELKQYTGIKGSLDSLIEEADTDGDGRISYSEFQKILRQASVVSRTVDNSGPLSRISGPLTFSGQLNYL